MKYLKISLMLALATASVACGDDDMTPMDAAVMDAAMDSTVADAGPMDAGDTDGGTDDAGPMDAGLPPVCPGADMVLDAVTGEAALALISTDFTSTALSLLSADETIIAEDWLTSGTTAPALTSALSGDVVFPTVPGGDGAIAVLDRAGVLSRFCIASGTLVGQLPASATDFAANPHDAILLGERGFISRYNPNLADGAPDNEAGSDLIGFNARTMERNDERVDLSSFGGTVTGLEDGAETDVAIAARPDRMVRVGNTLVVGLERLPVDLAGAARGAGEGTVALVNLETLEVTGFALEGGANCGQVVAVPDTTDQVIVACKGYSNVSFGGPEARLTTGLYHLTITDGAATLTNRWQPMEADAMPVWNIVALGGTAVAGVDIGDFSSGAPDVLVRIDIASGESTQLFEAGGAFAIGQSVLLSDGLRVPHAVFGEDAEVMQVGLDGSSSSLQYTDSLPSVLLTHL